MRSGSELRIPSEIGCGVGLAVGVPEAIGLGGRGRGAAKSDACAGFFVDEEQEARLRSDGDLNVIAGGFEGLAAFGEGGVKLVGALDGGAEDRRAEAMEIAACSVDDEKALRGEDCGVEIAEGLREGAAGFVGGDECVGRFGWAEELGGALDERRDGFVENDAAGGDCGFGSLAVGERGQFAAGGKGDVIDLGEIVIFTGKPEDGGVGMACGSGFARARNGGRGFERGIKRAAEETHLLAGENCARAFLECSQRIFRVGGGVLFGHEMNELCPVRWARRRCLRDFVRRQKGTERPGAKVEKEAALARHYGYWITIGFQGFVHSWLVWPG